MNRNRWVSMLRNRGVSMAGIVRRFRSPQTHLWLIKVWFSASTFVVKIATFAKPQNVVRHPKQHPNQIQVCMTLPTRPHRTKSGTFARPTSRHTKANLAKEPALCQRTAQRTPADEYLSSFVRHFSDISLLNTKAHTPPSGRNFYHLYQYTSTK